MDEPPSGRSPDRNETTPSADDAALGVVVVTARAAAAAGRMFAWAPGVRPLLQRSAATGREARVRGRERVETLVDDALAGPLPEAVARSSLEHHLVERITQQVFESPEFDRALERALSSPAVRRALAHQTSSAAAELADDVQRRGRSLDGRLSFGGARPADRYAGAASRGLAFAVDLILAQIAFLVGTAVVGLVVSLVGSLRPAWLFGSLAGMGWFLLVGAYFVFFWTLRGQTPGMRILGVRVTDAGGRVPSTWRAAVRFVALIVAIIPMLAGLVPILFEARRRGLHDLVAGTTVVYSD